MAHPFGGAHANDDANPIGIALCLDPIQCRECEFVGTILDLRWPADVNDRPDLNKRPVCGRCGSKRLCWDPPPLPKG